MTAKVLGGDNKRRTRLFKYHARVKTGRISVDDFEYTWRPVSITTADIIVNETIIDYMLTRLYEYRRQAIHYVASQVGIGLASCQLILTAKLGML